MPRSIRFTLGILICIFFLFPLYVGIIASLRPTGVPTSPEFQWFPTTFELRNYLEIFRIVPFGRYLFNSLMVVIIAVPLSTLIASLAGFGWSQLANTRLKQWILYTNVIVLMIPGAAVWIFRYQLLVWLNWIDTPWALIFPAFAATSPLFVLIAYWGYQQIPPEVLETAVIDGVNPLQQWFNIGLPLTIPSTTGIVILSFVFYWGDFVSPLLYIYDPSLYTLPVGLEIIKQMDITNTPLIMAASIVMIVPVLLIFWLLQRFLFHELSLSKLFEREI